MYIIIIINNGNIIIEDFFLVDIVLVDMIFVIGSVMINGIN